jgi:hypothetical protein
MLLRAAGSGEEAEQIGMNCTNWETQLSYDGTQACNEEERVRDAKTATVPKVVADAIGVVQGATPDEEPKMKPKSRQITARVGTSGGIH